eukprot:m.415053 g.415053  ORF g.415053 m.415053 type:complete len:369 (-) comp29518_c0_seq1:103-1209(-)
MLHSKPTAVGAELLPWPLLLEVHPRREHARLAHRRGQPALRRRFEGPTFHQWPRYLHRHRQPQSSLPTFRARVRLEHRLRPRARLAARLCPRHLARACPDSQCLDKPPWEWAAWGQGCPPALSRLCSRRILGSPQRVSRTRNSARWRVTSAQRCCNASSTSESFGPRWMRCSDALVSMTSGLGMRRVRLLTQPRHLTSAGLLARQLLTGPHHRGHSRALRAAVVTTAALPKTRRRGTCGTAQSTPTRRTGVNDLLNNRSSAYRVRIRVRPTRAKRTMLSHRVHRVAQPACRPRLPRKSCPKGPRTGPEHGRCPSGNEASAPTSKSGFGSFGSKPCSRALPEMGTRKVAHSLYYCKQYTVSAQCATIKV